MGECMTRRMDELRGSLYRNKPRRTINEPELQGAHYAANVDSIMPRKDRTNNAHCTANPGVEPRPIATLCIAAQEKHEKEEKVYADL